MSHPRSRSRSPEYRSRRYSPSRPLTPPPPLPPRQMNSGLPSRPAYSDLPPPQRSHSDGRDFPPAPSRRYESPPHRRYDDSPPGRRRSPPPRRYSPSPPPPPRRYDDGKDDRIPQPRRYDDVPQPAERFVPPPMVRESDTQPRGMAADREQERIPPPRVRASAEDLWERGKDVEELKYNTPTYPTSAGPSYVESGHDDIPRGPGGKRPSESSKDVIFLGLDAELTDGDFIGFLRTEHHADVISVKIVRDRSSGVSKCFGFANFTSLESAEEFINNNFPAILMPALYAHSDPKKVKIDFSATLSENKPFQNNNEPSGVPAPYHHAHHTRPGHDGTRDIAAAGSAKGKRVILLRGLNYHSGHELIVRRLAEEITRMVGKYGQEKLAEGAICRLVLIGDRYTRKSWGYGFVELATVELANALVPYLFSAESQPQGFIISQFPVAASFANPSAFSPFPAGPLGSEFLVHAARSGGIGSDTIDAPDGTYCSYWHEQGGALEYVPPNAPQLGEDGQMGRLSVEMRVFLGQLAGSIVIPGYTPQAQQTMAPMAMGPISIAMSGMQPIKIGAGKVKEEEGFVGGGSGRNLLEDDEEVDDKDTVLLSRTKGIAVITAPSSRKVKRNPTRIFAFLVAQNISKWNTKKTELATRPQPSQIARESGGPPAGLSAANSALGARKVETTSTPTSSGFAPISSKAKEEEFDYTDLSTLETTGKVACLLCQRQFKTQDVLRKHVVQSDLHKARSFLFGDWTNLLDASVCESGMKRKNATLGNASSTTTSTETDLAPKYRDRAAERRITHHQPDKPLPSELLDSTSSTGQNLGKRKYDGPQAAPPPPKAGPPPGQDGDNVGNKLLAKMGWQSGSGLGVGGEGRVDPVQVKQFEMRAGLGRGKGHEAGAWQGQGGMRDKGRDLARERYEDSGNGA